MISRPTHTPSLRLTDTLPEGIPARFATDATDAETMPADSLRIAGDTLAERDGGFMPISDSAFCAMPEQRFPDNETWRTAEARDVFGEKASLADGIVPDSLTSTAEQRPIAATEADDDVWASAAVNLLVIGVVSVYMFCIYRYFDDVAALFRSVFRRNVLTSGRVVERRRSEIFYGFLGKLFLLGAAFVGALTSEAALHGSAFVEVNIFYVPFAAVGVFLAVVAAQYILLAGMGFVTRSFSDIATLVRIRLVYFALATVMVAPVMLVAQISAGVAAEAWFAAGYLSAAVAAFFFLRESLMFFISKKISILHWFLYLCTIEIMPLSFLWQAAVRLRQ